VSGRGSAEGSRSCDSTGATRGDGIALGRPQHWRWCGRHAAGTAHRKWCNRAAPWAGRSAQAQRELLLHEINARGGEGEALRVRFQACSRRGCRSVEAPPGAGPVMAYCVAILRSCDRRRDADGPAALQAADEPVQRAEGAQRKSLRQNRGPHTALERMGSGRNRHIGLTSPSASDGWSIVNLLISTLVTRRPGWRDRPHRRTSEMVAATSPIPPPAASTNRNGLRECRLADDPLRQSVAPDTLIAVVARLAVLGKR